MKINVLEVNINKFQKNINTIKELNPNKEIMPIIKANAYGTYINKNKEILDQFNIVGVARIEEGVELRKLGYDKEIFVLNQPLIEQLNEINKYNLTIGISEISFIKKINIPIKAHLEIETGMNRTGIMHDDLDKYIEIIRNNKNIQVEGIYTHFAVADTNQEYTNKQIILFKKVVEKVQKAFDIKYIHSSASNGLLMYDDTISNLIRPGIIIYGYYPSEIAEKYIKIEPITKLKTKVVYIKELDENNSISYGLTYKTKKKTKVATIAIGYGDGLRRVLSNVGEVIINNKKCKIIGTICMDSCMIDITNVDVKVGDDVYIWDNNIIKLEEIAEKCDTINYEILTTISDRVERKYIN